MNTRQDAVRTIAVIVLLFCSIVAAVDHELVSALIATVIATAVVFPGSGRSRGRKSNKLLFYQLLILSFILCLIFFPYVLHERILGWIIAISFVMSWIRIVIQVLLTWRQSMRG